MKKVNKILLGSVLPFLGLSVTVPVIATSCSVTPATMTKTQWNSYFDFQPGFSLNSTKDELIFDASAELQTGGIPSTLDQINNFLFDSITDENKNDISKWGIKEIIKSSIVGYDSNWDIKLEGTILPENKDLKIATYNFILSKKDGLEISRLKLIIKNYLIEGTWSTKELDIYAKLSNDGKNLTVDLSTLTGENDNWQSLNANSSISAVESAIFKTTDATNPKELKETIVALIDKNNESFDKYEVAKEQNGRNIIFNITLKKGNDKKGEMVLTITKNSDWN